MGNVLKKNFPCAKCQHCGKITDIQLAGDWRSLVAQNNTLKEMLKFTHDKNNRIHQMKSSQLMTMHLVVKQLLDLMDEKQKEKARAISKFMRDELRFAEKKALGKLKLKNG